MAKLIIDSIEMLEPDQQARTGRETFPGPDAD